MITVAVQGAQNLRDVAAALKEAGRQDLRRELVKRIRRAGQPALRDAKAAILDVPANAPHGDLRRQISRATRMRVLTSRNAAIRIEANSDKLPAGKRAMPRVMDSRGWRHPVFGNREHWVFQPSHPWFFQVILKHAPGWRREIEAAMDDIRHQIEGAA